jgi:hypothetical protein
MCRPGQPNPLIRALSHSLYESLAVSLWVAILSSSSIHFYSSFTFIWTFSHLSVSCNCAFSSSFHYHSSDHSLPTTLAARRMADFRNQMFHTLGHCLALSKKRTKKRLLLLSSQAN